MKKLLLVLVSLCLVLTACAAPQQSAAPAPAPAQTEAPAPVAPVPAPEPEAPAAYEADVVIVGAGGAGIAAAIEAHDAGADVVILEKMNYAGGNTIRSEGGMNAAETAFQKEKGIEDTIDSMIADTFTGGKEISNPVLVEYLAKNSAPTIDWLTGIGMDMSDVGQGAGASFPRMHRPADGSKIGGVLVPVLLKNIEERGITILYSTKATELITDNGAVKGVIAVDAQGASLTFHANAVVVASGGFGANEEIYVQYRPDLKGFTTTNHPGSTGDGIVMAQAVGADVVDMDQVQTNPTVEVTTNIVMSETVRGKGAIFINQSGQRFVDEMLTRDVLSTAILEQPEKYTYLVFDQSAMDSMAALQENYEKGIITKGDDVPALAKALGIDEAAMTASIDTWNKAVAAKKDEAFGREKGMDVDLSKAPYYAVKVSPAVHYTMGGIKINELTEVISTHAQPIPGLYAAGETTGGLHGANRLGGNAVADIMVFGRQAGVQSAAYALKLGDRALVLPEAAAAVAPEAQGSFTDGVYKGSAKGRNADIGVEVTVSGGNITKVDITASEETEAIFAGVVRDLIPAVIKGQSLDVDAVAGATISSQAVLAAIKAALGV